MRSWHYPVKPHCFVGSFHLFFFASLSKRKKKSHIINFGAIWPHEDKKKNHARYFVRRQSPWPYGIQNNTHWYFPFMFNIKEWSPIVGTSNFTDNFDYWITSKMHKWSTMVSALNYKPDHRLFEYRWPIERSDLLRPTYLRYPVVFLWLWSANMGSFGCIRMVFLWWEGDKSKHVVFK